MNYFIKVKTIIEWMKKTRLFIVLKIIANVLMAAYAAAIISNF